jgi:hypothetical protein
MKDTVKEIEKKKGFWAAIWESMTKTGGCCGSGGNCCGSSPSPNDKKKAEPKSTGRTC